jgi:hypothetical protein
MMLTSIKLEDVEELEVVFAFLTKDGWIIPAWVIYLKGVVIARDKGV